MSILRKVLGPESKYDHRLPYTYEARVTVTGVPGMTENYVCDTLCGLLERLADEKAEPGDVTVLEVRPEGEFPVLIDHCLAADGSWLRRPEACRMFEQYYAGHERSGRCCYRDRSREADGPFVEYEPREARRPGRAGKSDEQGPPEDPGLGDCRRPSRSLEPRSLTAREEGKAGTVQIGIPREARAHERRVALTPSGVRTLVQQGHRVWVETGAGTAAGFPDSDYQSAGATVVFGRSEPFLRAELVACVHSPEPGEYDLLQHHQIVFAFWALATARPADVRALMAREITAVGIEAIEDERGRAPVLTSMSEIAGSLAAIFGAGLLLNEFGGKGILLGGAPGVPPANFVVLGAGVLGRSAARAALSMGAQVTLLDVSVDHLREAMTALPAGTITMLSTQPNIEKALGYADIVLGAVAVHGQRAPILVKRESLARMKPRSIVMDLSIDMGGCFETSRPTAFPDPTYVVDGILHFCVPNLPSAAARSATTALTNAQLPFLQEVARDGFEAAIVAAPALGRGTYLHQGRCVRDSLARALGIPCEPLPAAGGAEA